MKGNMNEQ